LQWLVPLGLVANIGQGVRTGLGAMIVIAGMATMLAGHRAQLRHGTNVNPLRPTTALVTDGVFRRTRNPLYVGVSVALFRTSGAERTMAAGSERRSGSLQFEK
jgi:protein-S-isoprenylcysteine O-methyltransferase Ste14